MSAAGALLGACVGDEPTAAPTDASTDATECRTGTEGCPCTPGGACDPGLTCASQLCVKVGTDAGNGADAPVGADGTAGNDGSDDASDAGSDAPPLQDAACAKLFPTDGSSLFCPFQQVGNQCQPTQECCTPAIGTSTCAAKGTACPADAAVVQCEGKLDCDQPTNLICCGAATLVTSDAGCMTPSTFTGTYCRTTCQSGELIICSRPEECPAGKTCTPFKTHAINFGACL